MNVLQFILLHFKLSIIFQALKEINIVKPTSIQIGVIPEAFEGKDICGCAMTGSGKTLAFLIPVVEKILKKHSKKCLTSTLVVVPSRELGVQVEISIEMCGFKYYVHLI